MHAWPWLDYVAGIVVAAGSYWVDHFAGVTNGQWHVVAPGAALILVGLLMPYDRRLAQARAWAPYCAAAGAALLMGTSLIQSTPGDTSAWLYVALMVSEAVVGLLIGIGFRSRALVIAAGAGAGVAALRAIFLLVQQGVALFLVFGAVALLLLAIGAALAVLRARLRTGESR